MNSEMKKYVDEDLSVQFVSDTIGFGIYAERCFKRDERMFILSGPVGVSPTSHTVPIMYCREKGWFFVDPVKPFSYINHSCDPNAGIRNRTCVVAMKDIAKGEQITIDYAMIVVKYDSTWLDQCEDDLRCACGSTDCRGLLGSYEALPEVQKSRYKTYISDCIFDYNHS